MLALRLFLLVFCIGHSASAFMPMTVFEVSKSCIRCSTEDNTFAGHKIPLENFAHLKEDPILAEHNIPQPKLATYCAKVVIPVVYTVHYLYFRFSSLIGLKLPGFSIPYPFHYFP
jgi:hypothetical protein